MEIRPSNTMKPILFNTEMVRAILDNRKTVTRRVVKKSTVDKFVLSQDGRLLGNFNADYPEWGTYPTIDDAPYCPGDILYVRETFFECRGHFYYKADGKHEGLARLGVYFKWQPSIHMPREAARIFLRVTDVRVERLQDINDEEALKEGFGCFAGVDWVKSPFYDFRDTWDTRIKPKDRALYGWAANPWVWVIEFERVSKEETKDEQNKN